MSFAASFDTKQRIKQAIDIVELVNTYLPSLRREGRAYKALCPWHDDTRPSLQVNPERQSFKCWVCNVGGDIFSFVMKIEGVEFPEALAMLADRANISLKAKPARPQTPQDDKRLLYQAMSWAMGQYHQRLLKAPDAEAARQYLADRKITAESILRCQLGFAPDEWSWISQQARGTPHTQAMLERVGLIVRRPQGPGYYDRFKGRVLFPIFDSQQRAVGLGGRVLPQLAAADTAKYVNSNETPLFSKRRLLYGLNLARDAIRNTGTVLVTEGYTDCIVAQQFGFENCVAVLGTAVGAEHLQLLRRYAERIRVVLVLDGDEAGRKRANEVLELFVSGNVDLRVLTLPENLDPADFLLARGAEQFAALIDGAADALEHAFRAATAGIDLRSDLHASSQALEQLVGTIAKAPRLRADTQVEDRLREEKFLQRLASDFRVPEKQVRELMTQLRKRPAARAAQAASPDAGASNSEKVDAFERELLEIVLQSPHAIEQALNVIQPAQIVWSAGRAVYEECARLWAAGIPPDLERLLLEIDDPVVKNLLIELDDSGRRKANAEIEVRLRDVLTGLERRQQERSLGQRTAVLARRQLTEEDELAVLLELERQQRVRQQDQTERARPGISDPTEG